MTTTAAPRRTTGPGAPPQQATPEPIIEQDPPAADDVVDAHASPTGDVEVPEDQAGIDVLRTEIDAIDTELIRLIQRRTALSHAIGTARRSLGGTRIVYSREMAILDRFRELGPYGTDLGMMLLAMGRGRLGRK